MFAFNQCQCGAKSKHLKSIEVPKTVNVEQIKIKMMLAAVCYLLELSCKTFCKQYLAISPYSSFSRTWSPLF